MESFEDRSGLVLFGVLCDSPGESILNNLEAIYLGDGKDYCISQNLAWNTNNNIDCCYCSRQQSTAIDCRMQMQS